MCVCVHVCVRARARERERERERERRKKQLKKQVLAHGTATSENTEAGFFRLVTDEFSSRKV